ncbi:hypothetical protein THF1C08_620014 [Vibrio jasicida]|uniref:Uncharacterized protein n=1 Tax=Vibrio jasicida TaxID=766224 RepID=A0AAU9QZS0_9VIBR|nr:hypothetical protein THF1C08_620014 [Vibrio jasicida]CAH1603147.1 hypothetical protein THF1A12_640014 [Vibrio jasicida]
MLYEGMIFTVNLKLLTVTHIQYVVSEQVLFIAYLFWTELVAIIWNDFMKQDDVRYEREAPTYNRRNNDDSYYIFRRH